MIKRTLLSLALAAACLAAGPSAHAQDGLAAGPSAHAQDAAQPGQRDFQRHSGPRMDLRRTPDAQRRPQVGQRGQRQQNFGQRAPIPRRQALRGLQQRRQGFAGQGFAGQGFAGQGFAGQGRRNFGQRQQGFGQRQVGQRSGFAGAPWAAQEGRGQNGPGGQKGNGPRGKQGDGPEGKQGGDDDKPGKRKGGKGKRRRGPGKKQGGRGGDNPPKKKTP
jgi:hypothetical protein